MMDQPYAVKIARSVAATTWTSYQFLHLLAMDTTDMKYRLIQLPQRSDYAYI